MTEHVTSTSWILFFKVLSVNKLCPVQFVTCPTKRKIWTDICPLNKEKLFPALWMDSLLAILPTFLTDMFQRDFYDPLISCYWMFQVQTLFRLENALSALQRRNCGILFHSKLDLPKTWINLNLNWKPNFPWILILFHFLLLIFSVYSF